ncbi:MAG: hypothetical protein PHR47_00655 [Candidatus Pacebacteria bacterium]|nr:hypothetical protein [Candidatus Paceibacterota bacterium]
MTESDVTSLPENVFNDLLKQKAYLEKAFNYSEKQIEKNMRKRNALRKNILIRSKKGLDTKALETKIARDREKN